MEAWYVTPWRINPLRVGCFGVWCNYALHCSSDLVVLLFRLRRGGLFVHVLFSVMVSVPNINLQMLVIGGHETL